MLVNHSKQLLFLHVKKAFDSVPHSHLIKALHSIGIQGSLFNWLRDYLTSRSQRVVLDSKVSSPVPVTSRVPQGSVLGSLMFNIFMNSVAQTPLSCNCHLVLNGDDILLFKPIDNQHDLQAFQNALQVITDWIQQHGRNPDHQKT